MRHVTTGAALAVRRATGRHAHRTDAAAIAVTSFLAGAAAALGVVALIVAGWHGLGAQ